MYLFSDEIRVSDGARGDTVIAVKMVQPCGTVPKLLSIKYLTRPNFMINQNLSANHVVGANSRGKAAGYE